MKVSFGEVMAGRQRIADYIFHRRSQGKFTVIDIGGSAIGWSVPIADAFVDINRCNTSKLQFNVDICRQESWGPIVDFVIKNGKFDYCICTHTLEDIYNPYLALDVMPHVAKSGIISMPSVKTETSFVENQNWLGFAHHRYMFGHSNDRMIVVPKLPVVEKLAGRQKITEVEEIRFEWEDKIPYSIFMNNYLGPNTDTVLRNYEQFIKEQIL